mgnify:CR=1 FL=1
MAKSESTKNVMADPVERKNFKIGLNTITAYMQMVSDNKAAMTETINFLADKYGLDKKIVRKMATTLFKRNYSDVQEENQHFEELYETIVEGAAQVVDDPLDDIDDIDDNTDQDNLDVSEKEA